MRITRRATCLLTLVLLCAVVTNAQEPAPAAAPTTTQVSEKEFATVYVYRVDNGPVAFWFLTKTLPVYFGEGSRPRQKLRKIAGLKQKRYFMMRLPPGTYTFDTRLMSGKLPVELAAGGEYHLRLERGNDCPGEVPDYSFTPSTCQSSNPSVEQVTPESWRKEMPKLKPIKAGNVRDPKLVIIPPNAPPAGNAAQPTAKGTT